MSTTVGTVRSGNVNAVTSASAAVATGEGASMSMLPSPSASLDAALSDTMSILYAITAEQRDKTSAQRAGDAERKGTERQQAFKDMQAELQKAKEAEEDGGWLDDVMGVVGSVTDAVVGGNPLQDLANGLSDATGFDGFAIAYDFIRPDALTNAAVMLTSEATGCEEIKQAYDVLAFDSSLKTRFQGLADATGKSEIMDAYAVVRDATVMAMVAVGTCGVGTLSVVAIACSAALIAEARADLLGELGVEGPAKMWIRGGLQAAVLGVNITGALVGGAQLASGGTRAAVTVVNGTNQVASGAVNVGKAAYEREAAEHLTESAKHQNTQKRADREQERLISGLREVSKSYQNTLGSIASAIHERDQNLVTLSRSIA